MSNRSPANDETLIEIITRILLTITACTLIICFTTYCTRYEELKHQKEEIRAEGFEPPSAGTQNQPSTTDIHPVVS